MRRITAVLAAAAIAGSILLSGGTLAPPAAASTRASDETPPAPDMTASDGKPGDWFGSSVAGSGNTALVGAPNANDAAGAAYVFVSSRGGWTQQAKLTIPQAKAGDRLGFSVALSGNTAVVGAPGTSGPGTAYVFVRSGSKWSLQATLAAAGVIDGVSHPSDGAADKFGTSVAFSGSMALVGAPRDSGGGTVEAFGRQGTRWFLDGRLSAPEAEAVETFGSSVAFSGNTAVVAAHRKVAAFDSGGVGFVFALSGLAWSQQAVLVPTNRFNRVTSVAVSGNTVVFGTPDLGGTVAGAASVFTRSGQRWTQQSVLTPSDGVAGELFGYSVAVAGNRLMVGAPSAPISQGHLGGGRVYDFVGSGLTWVQDGEPESYDDTPGNLFGISVARTGLMKVIGMRGWTSGTGAAFAE